MAIAKREKAFVIYGHDPEQWPQLKKTPEFYG
jgi:N-acyl homoserine lactone hydrolase